MPQEVLPKEKMTKILWDIILADELTNLKLHKIDSGFKQDNYRIGLYQKVVEKHKTTDERFQKSFTWYQMHPEQMKIILDSLRSLSLREMYVPHPKPVL
jgi:hypothetical protein